MNRSSSISFSLHQAANKNRRPSLLHLGRIIATASLTTRKHNRNTERKTKRGQRSRRTASCNILSEATPSLASSIIIIITSTTSTPPLHPSTEENCLCSPPVKALYPTTIAAQFNRANRGPHRPETIEGGAKEEIKGGRPGCTVWNLCDLLLLDDTPIHPLPPRLGWAILMSSKGYGHNH